MSLKKNKIFFYVIFCIFIFSNTVSSEKSNIERIKVYLNQLEFFSASFIQNDNEIISEGNIYVGDKRVRVEYNSPTKILIILDKNKAMYYNYELDEDEFFDPNDTAAWFFYDIFNNPAFFNDASILKISNNIVLEKSGFTENEFFKIKIYFEDKPLILRSIKLFLENEYIELSIFNHKYNETFDRNFFKLINPNFFD
ncbi:outer membrane lipoprotein carrier protein LolA [Pelagibacteraceae bacterium]|nr:outer membrane lipoprotein carrier protein LolA [Pelagibacteraceae bacterium]